MTPVGFFFNPNIHPFMEHQRRLSGVREVFQDASLDLITEEHYDPEAWFDYVRATEVSRCESCIGMRLDRAALEASRLACDCFSTTLAISPWQDHIAIKTQGEAAAQRHGVEFVYADLRAEYRESRRLSQQQGIYRQKYCGCLVSEWERWRGAGAKRSAAGEDAAG